MADAYESDYGMMDYGEDFYSYRPIWLPESDVLVQFLGYGALGLIVGIDSDIYIKFDVYSLEYIGSFWTSEIPEIPPEEIWIEGTLPSIPWIPITPISGIWVASAPIENPWTPNVPGFGTWIPVGPDMTPNEGP